MTVLQFDRKKTIDLALLLVVYGLCIALASVLWQHPWQLTGCLVLVSIFTLLKWHSGADWVCYATAAVLGPLGEAVAVHYGAWTYANCHLPVPVWLPLLWGIAGCFLRRLTLTLTSIPPDRK